MEELPPLDEDWQEEITLEQSIEDKAIMDGILRPNWRDYTS